MKIETVPARITIHFERESLFDKENKQIFLP